MTFTVTQILDALVEDVKQAIPDFKTVEILESEPEVEQLKQRIIIDPACLIVCDAEVPDEKQRSFDGKAGLVYVGITALIITRSMRQGEPNRTALGLLDSLRINLDGKYIVIGGNPTSNFMWEGNHLWFAQGGWIGYKSLFGLNQI